ncbi:MAG: catalase/peroxidase HPI, partial [Kangiellaceae bacterium]|nr:catalase/peroxidase HPI [Kangiellaceae bacterium]
MNKTTSLITAVSLALSAALASPFVNAEEKAKSNQFWWPERLDLAPLRQHAKESNPYGDEFNYSDAFASLNLDELKADIKEVLTTSQDWWPADYGNYGPFFIRMAWHSAGTYRVTDGRGGAGGGQQRFEPLNSWPDNGNLDKARRLLWPVKQKYGRNLSWADLMILAGNVSLESMGFKTFGFAGGRLDDWEADLVYWGPEEKMLERKRLNKKGNLKGNLGAMQMGLIYVNPEGPGGNHTDFEGSAYNIRMSFGRMAMNDEEIVALIAGGHTFGKAHGASKSTEDKKCIGPEPAAAGIEEQGFGWKNKCGKGNAEDTTTSGLEGAWTVTPTQWSKNYLDNLFAFEWEETTSPAGAKQWIPKGGAAANLVPDAHVKGKRHAPIMFTTDLVLKKDPEFRKIAKRFQSDMSEFEKAFAKAWFKLTHRDMGPRARYVGSDVPSEELIWQDVVPAWNFKLINSQQTAQLKAIIADSGISNTDLVKAAWASASSFRGTDMRGGADGARVRLAPQKDWKVNDPRSLKKTLGKLERIQKNFNKKLPKGVRVSLADVIVLAGNVGVEQAANKAGHDLAIPFKPGRGDAGKAQTDVASFNNLKPAADAFRNYYEKGHFMSPAEA